jgi:Flp pilus assembly protein TadG
MVQGVQGERSHSKSGQTMVEFAVVMPLLAVMLFGIIQYGFIFAAHITLRNATAVGARYATLQTVPAPTLTQIQNVTKSAAGPMLATNNMVVTVNTNVTVGGVSGAKSVQAQYNLKLIIPFVVPGATPGSSVTLTATTIMR